MGTTKKEESVLSYSGVWIFILYISFNGISINNSIGEKLGKKWPRQDLRVRADSNRPSLSPMLLPRDQAMAG